MTSSLSPRNEIALTSFAILYAELAAIRWFPAYAPFLTFFTNVVLLAVFLGMSIGLLGTDHRRSFLPLTPLAMAVTMAVARIIDLVQRGSSTLAVGHLRSPQVVYFGADTPERDLAQFVIPFELVAGFLFLAIALSFVGLGQALGKALARVDDRVLAYSYDIVGSLCGVAAFTVTSWLELGPAWWFLVVAACVGVLLRARYPAEWPVRRWYLALLPFLGGVPSLRESYEEGWSPYYHVVYVPDRGGIVVNGIGHQNMVSNLRPEPAYAYALPHAMFQDVGRAPFEDVLVIGAGSGNDVSRALAWGAKHVDAVEIDPAIQRIGRAEHPDRPYDDPRVERHIDDGRNWLRRTDRQYDLIVFALVDSLVLHSSVSNLRLESYLFTREAFDDVKAHLKPGGVFAMSNNFVTGWLVGRLDGELERVFGGPGLVFGLPYASEITPDTKGSFMMLLQGDVGALRRAFETTPDYWLAADRRGRVEGAVSGFSPHASSALGVPIGPARIERPVDRREVTDDWPFLYVREPMIPPLTIRGALGMLAIATVLLAWMRRGVPRGRLAFDPRMFFLGAGFMLVETVAVVKLALVFGSTWIVNSVVIGAVLCAVLGANAFVRNARPKRTGPFYVGVIASLALAAALPSSALLGLPVLARALVSGGLVFLPILFAGVIFARWFERAEDAGVAFGSNIAGAILGGVLENVSILVGFQALLVAAAVLYGLSIVAGGRSTAASSE